MKRVRLLAAWLVVILAALPGPAPAATPAAPRNAAPALVTARALARAMSGDRSAEARVAFELPDPLGGPARASSGRVRVEPPDRVRLDFASGERIGLRGDGGEWLQPASRQLLRISAERAGMALQWWRVLLPESRTRFREDSLGGRRFALTPLGGEADPMRIVVQLDGRGFPARLEVSGLGDGVVTYRLSGWSFGPARGAPAYRLSAPPGFETVDLP